MPASHWLMKTEPGEFSLDDLRRRPGGIAPWDGVRNYQARNFLRDSLRAGDRVIIYHSGRSPAAVGTARVVREGYPDPTARAGPHAAPRSTPSKPIWFAVDVAFESAFPYPVTLAVMRAHPGLQGMLLLRKGQRLSVMPVEAAHFAIVCALGGGGPRS